MSSEDLEALAALKKQMQETIDFSWTDQRLQGVQVFALVRIAEELMTIRQLLEK